MLRLLAALPFLAACLVFFAPDKEADGPSALTVGIAEVDVTPRVGVKDEPVYLAGFGKDRKATGVHDPIVARAVVLQHGKTKIAIVSVDVIGLFLPFVLFLVRVTGHENADCVRAGGSWGGSEPNIRWTETIVIPEPGIPARKPALVGMNISWTSRAPSRPGRPVRGRASARS